jgi:hypothetical protein
MAEKKDSIRTSVFIEKNTAEQIRKLSRENGTPITYIINKALKLYLEANNKGKHEQR